MDDDSFEGPTTLDPAGAYAPSVSTAFTPPTLWGRKEKLRYKNYTQTGIREMTEKYTVVGRPLKVLFMILASTITLGFWKKCFNQFYDISTSFCCMNVLILFLFVFESG